MLIVRNPAPDSREFGYVRAALERGELVVLPTDTVYGIAALAASEEACLRLYDVKGRDSLQPTAVLFADIVSLTRTLPTLSDRAGAACEVLLPGPLTLIVSEPSRAFWWLTGGTESLGIRIPDGALPLPPLAATSANLPGEPEAARVQDVPAPIAEQVACGIDGGELASGSASTVVDLTAWEWGGEPRILRDPRARGDDVLRALAAL